LDMAYSTTVRCF